MILNLVLGYAYLCALSCCGLVFLALRDARIAARSKSGNAVEEPNQDLAEALPAPIEVILEDQQDHPEMLMDELKQSARRA